MGEIGWPTVDEDFGFASTDDVVTMARYNSGTIIEAAGGPNRTNAYAMSNDGPHGDYTTKRVDRSPSLYLVCALPR